jgi:hypothetical protein
VYESVKSDRELDGW